MVLRKKGEKRIESKKRCKQNKKQHQIEFAFCLQVKETLFTSTTSSKILQVKFEHNKISQIPSEWETNTQREREGENTSYSASSEEKKNICALKKNVNKWLDEEDKKQKPYKQLF